MLLRNLLRAIGCDKQCLGKSEMTSGNAYKVTLYYRGHRCSFVFNDNFENKSTKKDFLYCLVLDAQAYDNVSDAWEFARAFGYEYNAETRKLYSECKKQSERLHRLFNDTEIDLLSTIE